MFTINASRVALLGWLIAAARLDAGLPPLIHEAVVEAPVEDVWDAFTTSEGICSWMVPVGEVDLRVGGEFRTSYNPSAVLGDDSTIINRILSFEPQRMLSIQNVKAPKGFQNAELFQQTWSVIYFEPQPSDRTHVRIVGMGYGDGPQWEQIYNKFKVGNEYTLKRLQEKFASGATANHATTGAAIELANPLNPLARFVGQWTVDGRWSSGEPIKARRVSEWMLDGKYLATRTFATRPDGSEYQRYLTIYYWDGVSSQIKYYNFSFNGKIDAAVVEAKDATTLFYPPGANPDGTSGNIKQQIDFTDDNTMVWTVWSRTDPAASDAWEQIIEATWIRRGE